jgi:hypothetical protein
MGMEPKVSLQMANFMFQKCMNFLLAQFSSYLFFRDMRTLQHITCTALRASVPQCLSASVPQCLSASVQATA